MRKRNVLIVGIVLISCAITSIYYKQHSIDKNIALLNATAVASGEDGYPNGPEYTTHCNASNPGPYPGESLCKNEVIYCGAEDSTLCSQVYCPIHQKEGK